MLSATASSRSRPLTVSLSRRLPAISVAPVRSRVQRIAAGGTRQGLMVERSALCADSTAVLGLGSRRTTCCVRCAHCARTGAASQPTKRAARADPRPVLLAAPQIAPARYRLPRRPPVFVLETPTTAGCRKAAPGQAAARLRGAEEHRLCGRARSAPSSTNSSQVSERSERSERQRVVQRATRPSTAGQSVRSTDRSGEALPPARARLCRAGTRAATATTV